MKTFIQEALKKKKKTFIQENTSILLELVGVCKSWAGFGYYSTQSNLLSLKKL